MTSSQPVSPWVMCTAGGCGKKDLGSNVTFAGIFPCRAALEKRETPYGDQHARATFDRVEVVLRKVGRKPGRAVIGRLLRAPRKGSVVVIEFADGLHEYVTTPVKRILRLAGRDVYYLQTANSRYRLEVRSDEAALLEAAR